MFTESSVNQLYYNKNTIMIKIYSNDVIQKKIFKTTLFNTIPVLVSWNMDFL